MLRHRTAALLGGTALLAGLAVPASTSAVTTKTVAMEDFAFKPATLRVAKGTKVVWRNKDVGTPHNVTSEGAKRFRSSKDFSRGSYAVTFRRAGTYRYSCTLHPIAMQGKVVVK
jgi:plastocyanin